MADSRDALIDRIGEVLAGWSMIACADEDAEAWWEIAGAALDVVLDVLRGQVEALRVWPDLDGVVRRDDVLALLSTREDPDA